MRTTRYRVGGGGGGGTPTECTPTAVFAETFGMDDFLQVIYGVNWPDFFGLADEALGVKVGLFDTLGMDDRLTLVQALVSHVDSFGVTEGALSVSVALFDTLGADDRLTFVDLLTTYADSFGLDDRLTLSQVVTVYADTVGVTDAISFADLFIDQLDTVAFTDDFGVSTTLFDTVAHTDDLKPIVVPIFADTPIQYYDLLGTVVNGIQVADSVPLSFTGDIDIAVALAEPDWSPAGFPGFIAKYGVAGTRSWIFFFSGAGTGTIALTWSTDGTAVLSTVSTVAVPFTDGAFGAMRVTMDVANGANRVTNFYTRAVTLQEVADGVLLSPLSEWTQLGATVTTAGTTSIFDSASPVSFGSQANGSGGSMKKIAGAAIRNGIEGTLVLDYRAADATAPYESVLERANNAPVVINSPSNFGNESRYAPVLGHADILTRATIANWTCARSGTPDTDPCGDGWIDQAAATTNHGNESPLIVKGKSTLANDERRGFVKFQRGRFENLFAYVGGVHTFTVRVTNTNALIAAVFTMQIWRQVGNPFTESTLTWNVPTAGGPAGGALIKSVAPSIAANTTQDVTITLTDAELDNIFASANLWVYLRMTGPTAATPITFNVVSREGGTVADRPTFDLDLRR